MVVGVSQENVRLSPIYVNEQKAKDDTVVIIPAVRTEAAEWENLPSSRVADVIKRLPGVHVTGGVEAKDLKMRGLDKEFSRTQVGPFMIPDGGEKRELQLNRVPAGMVGSLELLRLATSEYESDGLAGRLVVKPREIPESLAFDLKTGIGARQGMDGTNLRNDLLFGGPAGERFGYLGSLHHADDSYGKRKTKEFRSGGSTTKREDESEEKRFRSNDFYADLQWRQGRHQFNLRPLWLDQDEDKTKSKRTLDFTKPAASDESFESETESKTKRSHGSAFSHLYQNPAGWHVQSDAAWYRLDETKPGKVKNTWKEKNSALVFDKREDETEDKLDETLNFASKMIVPLDTPLRQEIRGGFALRARERERFKTKTETKANGSVSDKTGPKDNYFIDEDYYALFMQDQVWLHDTLSVLPGVRIERVDLYSRDGGASYGGNSETTVNPHLHTLWQPSREWNVTAAVGKVVARPKFDDLSPYEEESGSSITTGNPNLKPTEAIAFELAARREKGPLTLGANVFYRDVSDLIETVDTGIDRDGKDVLRVENVGDGHVHGAELEFRYAFSELGAPWLAFWSNHTFLDSKVTDADTGVERRFKDQPSTIHNAGVEVLVPEWRTELYLAANFVTYESFLEANGQKKDFDNEFSLDLGLRQPVTDNLSFFAEISNLLSTDIGRTTHKPDGSVETESEFNPRSFLIGMHYTF